MKIRLENALKFLENYEGDTVIVGNKIYNSDKTKIIYEI